MAETGGTVSAALCKTLGKDQLPAAEEAGNDSGIHIRHHGALRRGIAGAEKTGGDGYAARKRTGEGNPDVPVQPDDKLPEVPGIPETGKTANTCAKPPGHFKDVFGLDCGLFHAPDGEVGIGGKG